MKTLQLFLPLALSAGVTASATIVTEATRNYTVGYDFSDLQDPPVSFLQAINDSTITSLTGVVVGLNLVGSTEGNGFASEMFVSLNKDLSLTSILLNRVGVTSGNSVGQGYDGWNVSFQDGAANGDIHDAVLTAGVLTGLYEPDGRGLPTDTARPELLDVFLGNTGNGDWRLNVADLDLGGTMRLVSWSLTLTGDNAAQAVPEPSTYAAGVALLGLIGATWWRRGRANR
jgi:hypothetical protein